MADFSKQYSEAVGLGFYEFDLIEKFNECKDGYYVTCICEGFGSLAVMNDKGICKIALPDEENRQERSKGTPVKWVPLDEAIKNVKKKK